MPNPLTPAEARAIERLAEAAHDAYEQEAVRVGWRTNPISRTPWAQVPDENRQCTRAAVRAVLAAYLDAGAERAAAPPTPEGT